MKDQYFGDINDYRKYGLLRLLGSGGDLTLHVAWMLTPDDGSTDGAFRRYLQQPDKWRRFDPELYDQLGALLGPAVQPRVSLIEGTTVLARSTFHSGVVPDSCSERSAWRTNLMDAITASRADLVFFDPDNGIEVPSKPIGTKGSSKFLAWREVEETWAAGCSLLIYQHFPRKPREAFAANIVSEVQQHTDSLFIAAFRTAHVLFVLAAQTRHEAVLRQAIADRLPRWSGQIDLMDLECNVSHTPDVM